MGSGDTWETSVPSSQLFCEEGTEKSITVYHYCFLFGKGCAKPHEYLTSVLRGFKKTLAPTRETSECLSPQDAKATSAVNVSYADDALISLYQEESMVPQSHRVEMARIKTTQKSTSFPF